jgi:hypothetical protein
MGGKPHPLYYTWYNMHRRCYSEEFDSFPHYGGRGIFVCDRWHDFDAFVEDVSPRPDGCSLDRVDLNGPYEPRNVRWATSKQQCNNRSNTRYLTDRSGVTKPLSIWADELGISRVTLSARVNKLGMSDIEALEK